MCCELAANLQLVIYSQTVEGPIHISRENSRVDCKFWSNLEGGVSLSWHRLQHVRILLDHKNFAGRLKSYIASW